MKDTSWDHALEITADENGLAGGIILKTQSGHVEAGAAPGTPGSTPCHPPEPKRT